MESKVGIDKIRNFSIIAHIDHGKSTLSDRLIQACNGLSEREMQNQVLDSMDLEKERGITIKAQNVTLKYKTKDKIIYQLNLIDTPGHIDFSYEVSRSLSICEGALLIVDAAQGIEAQTVVNFNIAKEMGIKVIPIINKIDLKISDPDRIAKDIEELTGINSKEIIRCSAKENIGIQNIIKRIVNDIPHPKGNLNSSFQAIIFDSWFDKYLGVVLLICVKNGFLKKGNRISISNTKQIYSVEQMGIFTPKKISRTILYCGEIGWIICSIKNTKLVNVGNIISLAYKKAKKIKLKFKKMQPQVYSSFFIEDCKNYESLKKALDKLSLNDSSISYKPIYSNFLGSGFRCGFLGMLHMEIIQERLKREYNLNLIVTAPGVIYEILTKDKKKLYIDYLSEIPPLNYILEFREPIAECKIFLPKFCLGDILKLCKEKRGIQTNIGYLNNQISLTFKIPMSEIILGFSDQVKQISRGYASINYNFKSYETADLTYLVILVNGEKINELNTIVHKNDVLRYSKILNEKIHNLIQRQQFDIVIQIAIGNKIISRSVIKGFRKNVTEKCYGGDVSRKKKLLSKQKKGKKRMKKFNNFKLSKKVFFKILKITKN